MIVYRWVENGTSRHHPNGMTLTIYSMVAYDFDHTIYSNKWLGTGETFMEVISMQWEGITFVNLETETYCLGELIGRIGTMVF